LPSPPPLGPASIGTPIGGTRIRILDAWGDLCPRGVPGELHIGGVCLSRGYLHRPKLTAERFVPDPFDAGERLYRTGDLCRLRDDGLIEYLGRLDHQVKIRGFRVELGEIETVLSEHPDIRQAVVIAREHARGDKRLVGYLVGRHAPLPAA